MLINELIQLFARIKDFSTTPIGSGRNDKLTSFRAKRSGVEKSFIVINKQISY
jgi:hypothetical protein